MNYDLISREEAMDVIKSLQITLGGENIFRPEAKASVLECLDFVPQVDAEPVRHGRWVEIKGAIRCSVCANNPLYDYHGKIVLSKVCPHCYTKMDQEDKRDADNRL